MNNTVNSDLIRGNIDTIILRALYGGDRYGYDIIKEVEQRSSGKYRLKQPTLYSCLNRLENQGFVRSYWGTKSIGGRRKYYTLTDMGKELFIRNKTDWEYSKLLIDNLITDGDDFIFDEQGYVVSGQQMTGNGEELRTHEETAINSNEGLYPKVADNSESGRTYQETAGNNGGADFYRTENRQACSDSELARDDSRGMPQKSEDECQSANVSGVESVTTRESEVEQIVPDYDERQFTSLFESILSQNTGENNYTNKLAYEEYTPDKNIYTEEHLRADNYFKDFEDESDDDDELEVDEEELLYNGTNEEDHSSAFVFVSEPKPEKKPIETFYSYKTDPKTIVKPAEQPVEVDRDELWKMLESRLPKKEGQAHEGKNADAYVPPISDEQVVPQGNPEFFRKDQIQIRNYKKLQDSAHSMGEEIKIRSYGNASAKEFHEQYYIYSNKMKLKQYALLFSFILLEVIFCYLLIQLGLRKSAFVPASDLLMYVLCVLVGLMFPSAAFTLNWFDPNRRKRVGYNFKTRMIVSLVFMVQISLIVYLLNLVGRMPLKGDDAHYTTLILPIIMTLNIPINTIVYNVLFKSKKYAV